MPSVATNKPGRTAVSILFLMPLESSNIEARAIAAAWRQKEYARKINGGVNHHEIGLKEFIQALANKEWRCFLEGIKGLCIEKQQQIEPVDKPQPKGMGVASFSPFIGRCQIQAKSAIQPTQRSKGPSRAAQGGSKSVLQR